MSSYYLVRPETGMNGPFALTVANVRKVSDSPGVYILSNPSTSDQPLACYVGRSASLPDRLRDHIGNYDYFYVKYTDTEAGAFFTECRLFHKYGKATYLDNVYHPAIPAGTLLPPCSDKGCLGEAY